MVFRQNKVICLHHVLPAQVTNHDNPLYQEGWVEGVFVELLESLKGS